MPALSECRQGSDTYLYHAADLGQQLGKRRCLPAGVHGHAAQKAGTRREKAAVYSNAYRHRLSHAEGGLSGQIARKERKRNTTQAMSAERKSSLGSRNME